MIQQRSSIFGNNRIGFTLVELLVVISIIGILVGLLLPAVSMVRESARRTNCANNIRQLDLAIQSFDSAAGQFPMGAEFETGHSWISRILPYLDSGSLQNQINFGLPWDAASNRAAASTNLPGVQCPSAGIKKYAGFTDYCGISGSTLGDAGRLQPNNGVFFTASQKNARAVRATDITDGLSQTIAIVEAVFVAEANFGFWACGWHCFTQDDGGINDAAGGFNEIASLHPSGANVGFADGSTHFLNEHISLNVLGALCTRNGHEVVGEF